MFCNNSANGAGGAIDIRVRGIALLSVLGLGLSAILLALNNT